MFSGLLYQTFYTNIDVTVHLIGPSYWSILLGHHYGEAQTWNIRLNEQLNASPRPRRISTQNLSAKRVLNIFAY